MKNQPMMFSELDPTFLYQTSVSATTPESWFGQPEMLQAALPLLFRGDDAPVWPSINSPESSGLLHVPWTTPVNRRSGEASAGAVPAASKVAWPPPCGGVSQRRILP